MNGQGSNADVVKGEVEKELAVRVPEIISLRSQYSTYEISPRINLPIELARFRTSKLFACGECECDFVIRSAPRAVVFWSSSLNIAATCHLVNGS